MKNQNSENAAYLNFNRELNQMLNDINITQLNYPNGLK